MDMTGLFDEIKAKANEIVVKIDEAAVGLADEKAASYKAGYDLGYAEGKASVVLPDPSSGELLFTQADMDKLAVVAKEEQAKADAALFQPQIDELAAKVAALQAQVDGFPAEKEAAVLAKQAEIMADYASSKVDDKAFEQKYGVN